MQTCGLQGVLRVRNIGNNILLNLEVDPGSKHLNTLMWVAVCYDTGQVASYPLIMSKNFFVNIMGNLEALTPPNCS